jgi:hypothetical protein
MTKASIIEEKRWFRWLILLIISMLMFGSYYVYDAMSPINDYIQNEMQIDNQKFGLLATFYSLPNLLFLVVVAGFLLDRIGVKKAGTLYAFLILFGSLVTTIGAGRSFALMLVGRAIFGIGSEAAILVTNKVLARWFKGRELGFAFGRLRPQYNGDAARLDTRAEQRGADSRYIRGVAICAMGRHGRDTGLVPSFPCIPDDRPERRFRDRRGRRGEDNDR